MPPPRKVASTKTLSPRGATLRMGADPLRKALATLEPTREGFEGLTAELVNAATQGRLNLMSSGEQSGLDAISARSFTQPRRGCCQSNGNLSPFGRTLPYPEPSLDMDRPPLGQGG